VVAEVPVLVEALLVLAAAVEVVLSQQVTKQEVRELKTKVTLVVILAVRLLGKQVAEALARQDKVALMVQMMVERVELV
jgi:hypothetical protein